MTCGYNLSYCYMCKEIITVFDYEDNICNKCNIKQQSAIKEAKKPKFNKPK